MAKNTFEKIGALRGPPTLIIYLIGWPSAHFIPPLAPTLTAEQVAKHYRDHESAIKATPALAGISQYRSDAILLACFWTVVCQGWRRGMGWSLDVLGSRIGDRAECLYDLVLLVQSNL